MLGDIGCICKVAVDGTDCLIEEPQPFDPDNFSFKCNGPGARCEICIGIRCGCIVWVNGPFEPGPNADDVIAHTKGLWGVLSGSTEKFLADSICSGWRAETPDGRSNPDQCMKACAGARHENVNAKFKKLGCLKVAFQHGCDRHSECFHAVAAIHQIEMETDSPLAAVDCDDLRHSPHEQKQHPLPVTT